MLDRPCDFRDLLPPRGSLLGLDMSQRRIGVAGTDVERRLVTPLVTLQRDKWARDCGRLAGLVKEREAVGLVLGLPLNMDDSEGPAAQRMRDWARNLGKALRLPLLLQDERLTSSAVSFAIEEGRLPRPRKGQLLDHYAAAVILEDALRAMKG
ncbi:Holliday junction resolvase RuvX [Marinimicrococcus flavescens]|uniref:Putative pre-16S rRNA nuclease n=1 Tax=Marinimicrococcus flavescens TaxID=3031815 RepID=A0AAP4D697_9PROT|nr:Holliday junction resolvase RuvX [Marinimicrococcus flavescens]